VFANFPRIDDEFERIRVLILFHHLDLAADVFRISTEGGLARLGDFHNSTEEGTTSPPGKPEEVPTS